MHRYINTETNDQYDEFVRDESVLLDKSCSHTAPSLCLLRSIIRQVSLSHTSSLNPKP
jgi:hypothetical protein